MNTAELAFWRRLQRRAAQMQPEVSAAILRAFRDLRSQISEAQFAQLVEGASVERLIIELLPDAKLDAVFAPVRDPLRAGTIQTARAFGREVPGSVSFDFLSPNVVEGIRTMETRVITTLKTSTRELFRAIAENGLRDGLGPLEIARQARGVIGIAPNQLEAVQNFRRALSGEGRNPLDYELRDRRFDTAIKRGTLSDAQISRMTDAYEKRMRAFNAETNARTASLDASKLGNRLAWQDAIDKGILDGALLDKTWVGAMDDRERPEHVAMEGETVPFNQPFSNGQMIPGEDDYNCRCVARYTVRKA